MRIIDSQDRRKRKPPTSRRRASRRFASGFAPLESRQLPSVVAAVGDPVGFIGPLSTPLPAADTAPPPVPGPGAGGDDLAGDGASGPVVSGLIEPDGPGLGSTQGPRDGGPPGAMRPGWATPITGDPRNSPRIGGHDGSRVSLALAGVVVGGVVTPEFAFADERTGRISVVVGNQPRFAYQIDPGQIMVRFADLNRDGQPDLIVADCAEDKVLVFLGQAGGNFGTGSDVFRQFAVGDQPSGIYVGPVDQDRDGLPDLVVTNKGSDNVSILLGQGRGSGWTMTAGPTSPQLPPGSAPVRALLADINNDGTPDLFVLNSGTDDVYIYKGQGGGSFDVANPTILPVGRAPDEMFVGRFDHRPGLDLVTVNSGSDDLTFISSLSAVQPTTMTYSSGGTQPDAAIAIDPLQDGFLDLVVANGGDGRLALLQPASVGLQLAGVISRADLPSPTAIAPGISGEGGFDIYAATAGFDAAAILHFDLGSASPYLSFPLVEAGATNAGDDELVARLLPFGDSSLDIVAVLWSGSDALVEGGSRSASPETAYYARMGVQGLDDPGPVTTTSTSTDPGPSPRAITPDDPTSWLRFVLGAADALARPLGPIDAVGVTDAGEGRVDGRAGDGPDAVGRRDGGLDARAVDDALSSLWSEGSPRGPGGPDRPVEADSPLAPDPGGPGDLPTGLEAQREGTRSEAIPVVSSTLLAARLILKASPPRPPSLRKRSARQPSIGPVGGRPPRL